MERAKSEAKIVVSRERSHVGALVRVVIKEALDTGSCDWLLQFDGNKTNPWRKEHQSARWEEKLHDSLCRNDLRGLVAKICTRL